MGTYFIQATMERALRVVDSFALAEGIGPVRTDPVLDGRTRIVTAHCDSETHRVAWVCQLRGAGLLIEIEPSPSRERTLRLHAVLALVAMAVALVGGILLVGGIQGLGNPLLLLAMAAFGVGLHLYTKLRYVDVNASLVALENRFALCLQPFAPQVEQPPSPRMVGFPAQALLLHLPIALLVAGAIRASPLLGLPAVPMAIGLIVGAYAKQTAATSPRGAWRLLLAGWASTRAGICQPAFVVFSIFVALHAVMLALEPGCERPMGTFISVVQLSLPPVPQGTPENPVIRDGILLRQVLTRPGDWPTWLRLVILVAFWWCVVLLGIALALWQVRGFWHWARLWSQAAPGGSSSLAPPSLRTGPWTGPSKGLMLAWLVLVAATNILHGAMTLEIGSVLLRGKPAFVGRLADLVGWIVLDYRRASQGVYQASVEGTAFAVLLTLPTLFCGVVWISLLVRGALNWLKRHSLSSSPVAAKASRLSAALGIRCPRMCVVNDDRPCLEARIPWMSRGSVIAISRSALGAFTEEELEAAIAHELAHVKNDVWVIRLTQWASLLAMFPCNVFAILLDTESREEQADRVAIELCGKKEPLTAAILKVSLRGMLRTAASPTVGRFQRWEAATGWWKRWEGIRLRFLLLVALCQPDVILGYAHPHVLDRLRAIDEAEDADSREQGRSD